MIKLRRSFMYVGGGLRRPTTLELCEDDTVVFAGKPHVGTWTVTTDGHQLTLIFDHQGRPDRMRTHMFERIPNTDGWMYIASKPRFNVTLVPLSSSEVMQ